MKKIVSFALAACMLLSIVPMASATRDYIQGTQVVYTSSGTESYTITVPALLAPGGDGTVTLSGTWASNRTVTVTADPTVTLSNSIKAEDQKVLNVYFDGISEVGSNTTSQTFTKDISVDSITDALFGTWYGKFNYNVESSAIDTNETPGIKFYQPYRYTDIYDGDRIVTEFVFHENGAVDTYESYYGADGSMRKEGASIPEGTCTYDDEYVYVGGEPAFQIGPNGSCIEMDGERTFTLVPTQIKYLQYGETYVNDWIVEEDYPHAIFAEDGSAKYYGDGGAEQSFPAGTFVYKDRYIEFNGENCAVYPDGTKIVLGDILLEIGCPHKDTELRNVSDTYTGDEYCKDCGKLLNKGEIICLHTNTELRNVSEEYTGDTYCKDCGKLIANGESLLISFYIDSATYQAIEGMTWEEWCNSDYNNGIYGNGNSSFFVNGDYYDGTWLEEYEGGAYPNLSRMISDDGFYSYSYVSYYTTTYGGENNGVLDTDEIINGYHYGFWPYK